MHPTTLFYSLLLATTACALPFHLEDLSETLPEDYHPKLPGFRVAASDSRVEALEKTKRTPHDPFEFDSPPKLPEFRKSDADPAVESLFGSLVKRVFQSPPKLPKFKASANDPAVKAIFGGK